MAVNTILSDAEAEREATDEKCAAIKRASHSASAKAATVRLREVMKQVDAEETPLNHVTRVHRGAAAAAETDEGGAQVDDAAAAAAVATAGARLEGEAEGAELEPRVEQEIEVGADEDEAEAAEPESPAEPEMEALVSTEVTTPTDAERTADGKRRMQSAIERAIFRGELEACGHSMLSIMWKCLTCCEVGNPHLAKTGFQWTIPKNTCRVLDL